jgi:hypothetical protein
LGFVDGIRPKKRKEDSGREPIFSELITNSDLEDKHEERLLRLGDKIHQEVFRIPNKREIIFSSRKKVGNFFQNSHFPKFSVKSTFVLLMIGMLTLISLAKIQSVKAQTNQLSEEAQSHLEKAFFEIEAGDLAKSLDEANLAKDKIEEMKMLAQAYGQDIQYFRLTPFKNSKLSADERLLDASYNIINTMTSFNKTIAQSTGSEEGFLNKSSNYILNLEKTGQEISGVLDESHKKLLQSKSDLEKICDSLDSSKQENVDKALAVIDKSLNSISFFGTLVSRDLPWLSGADGTDKKLLILFQNNAELRGGSGGSLGSFGTAHFSEGKLKNIDFGKNIYKLDKPFAASTHIEPPEIIKFLNPNWVMKDSGWAVDGPESSKTILDFYKKETGETIDGITMIDTTAIVSLLKVIGPIDMTKYDKSITAENFRPELENEVHESYFDKPENLIENEPKRIISDMMPIFIEKVLSGLSDTNSAKILASLSNSLSQKDITFYFTKEDFQQNIEKLNYSGSVLPSIGDYLYINNSNIAGQKSSLSVEETVKLTVDISANGKITDSINLQRNHKGKDELPDGINRNFVRLLLPENSSILSFTPVTGSFEQMGDQGYKNNSPYWNGTEAGKSVLNFWMTTNPGQKSELNLSYEPNYKVDTSKDFTYNLAVQKQPGANPDNLNVTIKFPEGFTPANVKNYDSRKHEINLTFYLDQDKTYKIQFKKD